MRDKGQGRPWTGLALIYEGQGQGRQNQVRAGPDRPVDSLSVVAPNKVYGLASAWMSGKDVIVLVVENSEP